MMAYAFKTWDAGRKLSDDPKVWFVEGIDRSGSIGALMEMNNVIEKMSGNGYGIRPLIGASQPASRFVSRSVSDTVLGPTFGSLLDTVVRVGAASVDGNKWQDSDTRAMRRLIIYQNLMIFRQLVDKLEGKK